MDQLFQMESRMGGMMSYSYQVERDNIFTEKGQVMFLKIRDNIKNILAKSGAFRMGEAMIGTGDSWTMIACVDRLRELGEILEIPQDNVAGQDRVFIRCAP